MNNVYYLNKEATAGENSSLTSIKEVVEKENKSRQLRVSKEFRTFLEDTELLSKAHSQKEEVTLEDIFVYPELIKYDTLREYDSKNSAEELVLEMHNDERSLIAGENQSGKTSLCKKFFIELRMKNYIPVYISPKYGQYQGNIKSIIVKALKDQYEQYATIDETDKHKIIPILDDFHKAKTKENHIGLVCKKFCKVSA
jgi:ATPase subunit of ABC transporter with duplicated ATPase domains